MEELVAINILIGDRTYRIKLNPKDEETVRRAVKLIQEKVIEFKTMFAGKDMQDYIAMVLVWFATDQNAAISNQVNLDNVSSRLQTLEKAIDSALEDAKFVKVSGGPGDRRRKLLKRHRPGGEGGGVALATRCSL